LTKNRIYLTISVILIYLYYIFIIGNIDTFNNTNINYSIKTLVKACISTLFILIISSLFKSKYINLFLFIVISFISSILLFINIQYGNFEIGSYASIMETNIKESKEMFDSFNIPFVIYLQLIITPFILFKINQNLVGLKSNSILTLILIILICLASSQAKKDTMFLESPTGKLISAPQSRVYYIFNSMPLLKPINLALLYSIIKKQENKTIISEWEDVIVSNTSNKKNYVVIIGESVQKSHLFFYGYNRKTTKALKETSGITLISDPIAPAPQTSMALSRVLAINDKLNVNSNLNIIDLANLSGFKTFWFSNQGQSGVYDSRITNIAKRADSTIFHNKDFTQASSDLVLIDDLKNNLDGTSNNIYFLHMIGSHSDFCERTKKGLILDDAYREKLHNQKNCYDDSILNTSLFMDQVVSLLKLTSLDYEVIYFSDHGLVDIDKKPYYVHGVGNLFNRKALEVPLIFFSSNKKHSEVKNMSYFMRDFPHTFAEWLGVNAIQIDYTKSVFNSEIKQETYIVNDASEIIYFSK
jgi:glucan phosphoethanolaminetransferase (alkaline phosphatase superfamily)